MTQNAIVGEKPKNIRHQVFAGMRWTGLSQVAQQLINLLWSVVMARLLLPDDFGLLAMASVFTGIVFFVLDLGLSAVIIQKPELETRQISSIFWLNVLAGVLMTLVGIVLAAPIAWFYRNPAVQPVVVVLSLNFLVFSLSATQSSLLHRQMDFKALELRTLVGLIVGTAASIAMAVAGLGVWSLVGRLLIAGIASCLLLWSVSGWRPGWYFRWADVKGWVGFSNEVLASNLLAHVGRNADNLLIGRFVGAMSLGYYAMAYNVMMFPVQRFSQVLASVLFPALSRLQEDTTRLTCGWFRAARLIGAVTIPLMVGLVVLAEPFVRVVYGEKWLPVVPVLRILAVSGAVQSLGILDGTVLLALGHSRLRLQLTAFAVGVAVISFIVGLPGGVIGVAGCFVAANLCTSIVTLLVTLRCLQLSAAAYLRNLRGVLLAACAMGAAELLIRALPLAPAPLLLVAVPAGIALYIISLQVWAPAVVAEALQFVPERLRRRIQPA